MCPRIGLDVPTILQAAAEIADVHGVDAITLASLAKKLDVRPPSLYNHIDGLHGLRKKLSIYGLEQLYSIMTQVAVGRSGDEAVRALGEAYVTFARTHPGLYEAALVGPDLRDPDVQRAGNQIVDLLLRVLGAYDLGDEAALHVVRGLRSIFHGFASLEQQGGFQLRLDRDVSLRLLIDTYLAGIRSMHGRIHEINNR
ncbi:WHG domain-containing protein [Brevibacillus humidisoli]|uniref:TetR-like C-terminal domain-containing protein n=1 Tax=Brevibacillus humidisoli TaxID=2895522 RepID=UPI001E2F78ED|nr:TetR-like C-terminal domain-containing protein [Brevibacillus humidisoli]UFJ38887.1 WHG domain-containing protein [Brevibacillus humidisoli]